MTTWNLPTDEHTAEWAQLITKDFLGRRGCDESCRTLAALVSRELVNDALGSSAGPVILGIECSGAAIAIRTSAIRTGPRPLDERPPSIFRGLVANCERRSDEETGRTDTTCELRCVMDGDGDCRLEEVDASLLHPTTTG